MGKNEHVKGNVKEIMISNVAEKFHLCIMMDAGNMNTPPTMANSIENIWYAFLWYKF